MLTQASLIKANNSMGHKKEKKTLEYLRGQ